MKSVPIPVIVLIYNGSSGDKIILSKPLLLTKYVEVNAIFGEKSTE
jgi:hypothetical protein